MTHSMTGFARAEARGDYGGLVWEVRTVNHRYLEAFFRVPEELRALEGDCRKQAAAKIKRGKLDGILRFERAAGAGQSWRLDTGLARQVIRLCREVDGLIREADGGDGQASPARPGPVGNPAINPLHILQWPGVAREPALDIEPVAVAALELLDQALDELVVMRRAEGERLKNTLLRRCADIKTITEDIRARRPQVITAICAKLDQRLQDLAIHPDKERLEQELALQAQKMDIDEELDRLQSHTAEVTGILDRGEPIGRRLDFLIQELHREANTLAAKAADIATTKSGVELKTLIEQMREQAQNVE